MSPDEFLPRLAASSDLEALDAAVGWYCYHARNDAKFMRCTLRLARCRPEASNIGLLTAQLCMVRPRFRRMTGTSASVFPSQEGFVVKCVL